MDLAYGHMGHIHPYTGREYEYIVLGLAYHQHGNMHDHSLVYTCLFFDEHHIRHNSTMSSNGEGHTYTHTQTQHKKANKKNISKNVQGHSVIQIQIQFMQNKCNKNFVIDDYDSFKRNHSMHSLSFGCVRFGCTTHKNKTKTEVLN